MNELTGQISGGWGFVIAVYSLTWVALVVYAGSLAVRSRREGGPS